MHSTVLIMEATQLINKKHEVNSSTDLKLPFALIQNALKTKTIHLSDGLLALLWAKRETKNLNFFLAVARTNAIICNNLP